MPPHKSKNGIAIDSRAELTGQERDGIIIGVVKRYERHPQVVRDSEQFNTRPSLRKSPTDLVSRYFEEAGQYALLTAEDELRLFSHIEHGIKVYNGASDLNNLSESEEQALINLATAYQTIYKSNTKLVISIAEKYAGFNVLPFIDLIQEGNIGLSKGITRNDITRGYKFSTYATQWIDQNITRAMADTGRTIRLPVHRHEQWLKLNKVFLNLSQKLDREATVAEVAEVMGMSAKQVDDLQRNGALTLKSLNEPIGDGEDSEMGDIIADPFARIDSAIDNLSNRQYLMDILVAAPLNPKELSVLCLRNGVALEIFNDVMVNVRDGERSYEELMHNMPTTDGLTLETIGELFGLTRERVRQLEASALEKIRINLDLQQEEKDAA